jgi:hypothetical protein
MPLLAAAFDGNSARAGHALGRLIIAGSLNIAKLPERLRRKDDRA